MADDTDADKAVDESITQPRRAETDMGSAEQHSLQDQIAAARYARARRVAEDPLRGLTFKKIVPEGTQ